MKRSLLAILVALSAPMTGCGGDNGNGNPPNPNPNPPLTDTVSAALEIPVITEHATIRVKNDLLGVNEIACPGMAMNSMCTFEVKKKGTYVVSVERENMIGVPSTTEVTANGTVRVQFGALVNGVHCAGIGAAVDGIYENDVDATDTYEVSHETTEDGCVSMTGLANTPFIEDGYTFDWRNEVNGMRARGTISADLVKIRYTVSKPNVEDAIVNLHLKTPF